MPVHHLHTPLVLDEHVLARLVPGGSRFSPPEVAPVRHGQHLVRLAAKVEPRSRHDVLLAAERAQVRPTGVSLSPFERPSRIRWQSHPQRKRGKLLRVPEPTAIEVRERRSRPANGRVHRCRGENLGEGPPNRRGGGIGSDNRHRAAIWAAHR